MKIKETVYNAKTKKETVIERYLTEQEIVQRERTKSKCEKRALIISLKAELAKYKEDVEQVELFGMERTDYEEKKKRCADIILELRILEKEVNTNE